MRKPLKHVRRRELRGPRERLRSRYFESVRVEHTRKPHQTPKKTRCLLISTSKVLANFFLSDHSDDKERGPRARRVGDTAAWVYVGARHRLSRS